jgi:hypothetical protein
VSAKASLDQFLKAIVPTPDALQTIEASLADEGFSAWRKYQESVLARVPDELVSRVRHEEFERAREQFAGAQLFHVGTGRSERWGYVSPRLQEIRDEVYSRSNGDPEASGDLFVEYDLLRMAIRRIGTEPAEQLHRESRREMDAWVDRVGVNGNDEKWWRNVAEASARAFEPLGFRSLKAGRIRAGGMLAERELADGFLLQLVLIEVPPYRRYEVRLWIAGPPEWERELESPLALKGARERSFSGLVLGTRAYHRADTPGQVHSSLHVQRLVLGPLLPSILEAGRVLENWRSPEE